jgi:hypothetical protein
LYEIKPVKDYEKGLQDASDKLNYLDRVGINLARLGPSVQNDPLVQGITSAPDMFGKPSVAVYVAVTGGVILYRGLQPIDPATFSISNEDIMELIQKTAKERNITIEQMMWTIIFSGASRLFPLRNLVPIP